MVECLSVNRSSVLPSKTQGTLSPLLRKSGRTENPEDGEVCGMNGGYIHELTITVITCTEINMIGPVNLST